MDIDKFSPAKHLLLANRTSGGGYRGQDVYVAMDSLKEAMSVPNIIKYRIEIPSADAAALSTTPYLLNGIKGSFAIISGVAYLSSDASDSLTGIGAISIADGSNNIYFKSGPLSILDPGNIAFISSSSAVINIPKESSEYYVFTTTDSSTTPGGPLTIILYLIDLTADLL